MECPYGWAECPYWLSGDVCLASDQSDDYCPCFDGDLDFLEREEAKRS